jgi:hypothetical protein
MLHSQPSEGHKTYSRRKTELVARGVGRVARRVQDSAARVHFKLETTTRTENMLQLQTGGIQLDASWQHDHSWTDYSVTSTVYCVLTTDPGQSII